MPSNYVGAEANTQAPSAKPESEADITLALPVDGEDLNVASIYQSLKALADFVDFLMHPQAKAALTPRFLRRYLTRVGHTRWALDRIGLPAATVLHWQELWGRTTTLSGATAEADFNGAIHPWRAVIVGSGGAIGALDDTTAPYVELDGGDSTNDYAGLWSFGIPDFGANADMAVESAIAPLGAPDDVEMIFGMVRRDTADPRGTQGLRIIATPGEANFQAVSTGASGETIEDTGVAVHTGTFKRLRIEFRGGNTNDGGSAAAYFFIDGAHAATITTNLPSTNASRKAVVLAAKNLTGNSGAGQKVQFRAINMASCFHPAVTS